MSNADVDRGTPGVIAGIVFGAVLGVLFGVPLGWLLGVRGPMLVLFALLVGWLSGFVVRRITNQVSDSVAGGFLRFLWPSGDSTPYQKTYSFAQALAIQGDYEGALAEYRAAMASNPTDPEPRIQLAELFIGHQILDQAIECLSDARRLCGKNRARELYVTQRLIDLYLDKLHDRGRALVELRRLVERFPGTAEAKGAASVISRLKTNAPLD